MYLVLYNQSSSSDVLMSTRFQSSLNGSYFNTHPITPVCFNSNVTLRNHGFNGYLLNVDENDGKTKIFFENKKYLSNNFWIIDGSDNNDNDHCVHLHDKNSIQLQNSPELYLHSNQIRSDVLPCLLYTSDAADD